MGVTLEKKPSKVLFLPIVVLLQKWCFILCSVLVFSCVGEWGLTTTATKSLSFFAIHHNNKYASKKNLFIWKGTSKINEAETTTLLLSKIRSSSIHFEFGGSFFFVPVVLLQCCTNFQKKGTFLKYENRVTIAGRPLLCSNDKKRKSRVELCVCFPATVQFD